MNFVITAIENDGLDSRILSIALEVLDESIDVIEACKEAAREYVTTEEGLKTYIGNCDCFNWADFEMYVPNEICERHGFRKLHTETSNAEVNWDEQLTDEPTFLIKDIQWDTDGEDIDDLPDAYYIPFSELMDEDEALGDIDVNDLKDRIADYLSDKFGWCIFGFVVE